MKIGIHLALQLEMLRLQVNSTYNRLKKNRIEREKEKGRVVE